MNRKLVKPFMTFGLVSASVGAIAIATPASAQTATRSFDIPAQKLSSALIEFNRQSGTLVMAPSELTEGKSSTALRGRMTSSAAITRLLGGTGLRAVTNAQGGYRIERAAVQAEDTSEATSEGGDIIVTASRREQRVVDVPMSMAALPQEALDQRGVVSLLDLSRAVPGLVVVEQGPGQNQIFLRGVANPNGNAALVGVYLDEIPVTAAPFAQLDLQLVDLERVEVLRGPQGTLYGQGSTGGTVRLISGKPNLNEVSGEASLSLYTTRNGSFSERLNGFVNLPVVEGSLGFRVSGTLANLGGWVDQPDANRKNINDQLIKNIRVKGLWAPADALEVEGTVVVHRNKGDGLTVGADENYNVYFPDGDPNAQEYFTDEYELYNLTARYDFGGVELMSSTSNVDARTASAGISLKLAPGLETFNTDTMDASVFSQEVRLSSKGKRRLNWVIGGFYSNEDTDRLQLLDFYFENAFDSSFSLRTIGTSKSISAFGDISYSITDSFDIGTGIRYFHDRRTRARPGTPTLSDSYESVNPRFYASYKPTNFMSIYANVAKGFRSGGFQATSSYDPEHVWSYEIGTKGSTGQIRWDIDAFYSRYKDYQSFVYLDPAFGTLINAGTGEIYGVDWALSLDPVRNLTLEFSGNMTSATLVSVPLNSTANIEGDRLDYVPDYAMSGSAEYRFDWGTEMPGFARVDFNIQGPATLTDRESGFIEVPSDTLTFLNARLGFEHKGLSVELFGDNLLNENGKQDTLTPLGFGTRPRPRVLGTKFRARF